jgi:hypothetical protein
MKVDLYQAQFCIIAHQDWLLKRNSETSIYTEYEEQNPRKFQEKFHMTVATFNKLLCLVEPLIKKQDTHMRKAIPAKVRLQVTLRYYVSGSSYKALEDVFRNSNSPNFSFFILAS